jgi:hypothetical protein
MKAGSEYNNCLPITFTLFDLLVSVQLPTQSYDEFENRFRREDVRLPGQFEPFFP